jgi:hypothetical protein
LQLVLPNTFMSAHSKGSFTASGGADGSGARLVGATLLVVLAFSAAAVLLAHSSSPRVDRAAVYRTRAAGGVGYQLTRWRRVGYWAHPVRVAKVHVAPLRRSLTITSLRLRTEEGFPEVYLVLRRIVMPSGRIWLKIALPLRPNGTTGWVLRGALGRVRTVRTWLVVDRRALRISFFSHGRRLWTARVGIGKPTTPTPNGLFWVREEFVLPDQAFYGPYAFGTSAYASISDWPGGGVVGLHGTSEPQLIPGRPSHGCIRLRNPDILWLARHVPVGTPLAIVN